ncbi:MAG: hypothetical protein DKM50_09130 [Candidatus Margulisiibacteriota bacterium]|nr:MAG: hypothetical protein A2X43_02020 [Candidatus Margulisbacteria bacterium GWD2_39_127]OGI03840.1 MAG: hypothetical protein A2X42_03525 [Candidatus Margulisbacteria bacterium GWF2_38_17]OGI06399.1 MAG: hypothetical protein A2X41_06700 [Candidatus Margulisbacteria bacterium GWE2_39_32]PZM79418.1 MAG: hypothetical protein DKM50_09130 [Candidatus Margulisiibacteriota bacterium]HAR63530.1 hypothetical protein [Candidatus Margulisiibacteriota bacterium]
MGSYYYLAASLPHLKFAANPPITVAVFLEECKKWLSEKDLDEVTLVNNKNFKAYKGNNNFLKEWIAFEHSLKASLAQARKPGHNQQDLDRNSKKILEQSDPLLMEISYEQVKWDFLEDKEFMYHFDINFLMIYCIKTGILERLANFDKNKGKEKFYQLCEVTYEQSNR